VLTIAGR